ncbi:PH domain-containing protein [Agrococcus casei]|uniref:PH domain-containing protein n=1 Tax=Agrococcus casei TaxID=343512 RepID=UPI003F939CCA
MSDPQDERVIARVRPHARTLILPTLVLWALSFTTMFLLGRVDWSPWNAVVLLAGGVLVAILCVFPFLAWMSRRYTFTTRRVTLRSGFGGIRREVQLNRVHDVTLRRRGLQMMFRSGDVLVSTGGERAIVLADVPNASLVHRALNELLEEPAEEL